MAGVETLMMSSLNHSYSLCGKSRRKQLPKRHPPTAAPRTDRCYPPECEELRQYLYSQFGIINVHACQEAGRTRTDDPGADLTTGRVGR